MMLRRPLRVQRERLQRRGQTYAWLSAHAKVSETVRSFQHAVRRFASAPFFVAFLELRSLLLKLPILGGQCARYAS